MKISKIEPQKKNKKRSSVYINGSFAFGLSNEVLLNFDLHEGDQIDDGIIQNILLAQEKQKIRERALRILHYRKRSALELQSRLIKVGFDNNLVQEVIEEFLRDNTLNDENFAESFVADYTNLKPKGNIFISRELAKRGVCQQVIQKVISIRDEKQMVSDFLRKKLAHLRIKNPKDRRKILRRLLSRGFTPGVVYDVLNSYEE